MRPQCMTICIHLFKPLLNHETFSHTTFSSSMVFVTQNVQWLNLQIMFDQTSDKDARGLARMVR